MKLLLIAAISLLPSAFCPGPSTALEINFDDGNRVYLDEHEATRVGSNVVYDQTIFIANESFKVKSSAVADCDRNTIMMSLIEYYSLDDDYLGVDRSARKIDVKPNTIYQGVLETVCSLEGIEFLKRS